MDLTRTYQHKGQADIRAALEAHSGQRLSSAAVLGAHGDGRWDWVLTDMANFLQKWPEEKHKMATLRTVPLVLSGEGAGIAATQKYSYFWPVPVLVVFICTGSRLETTGVAVS